TTTTSDSFFLFFFFFFFSRISSGSMKMFGQSASSSIFMNTKYGRRSHLSSVFSKR
ncbi:hypothetical protein CAPTEDRAFT_105884, partial [Capitella teleta]